MPTIQQLVRKGRAVLVRKEQITGVGQLSSASWRLCPCVHYHTEET